MYAQRLGETANAPQLDVHDPTGTESDRLLGMVIRPDALVQTYGSLQGTLERGVIVDLVVAKGLFQHHEVEVVQCLQARNVV